MPDPLADLSSTVTELPATTSTPNTLDSSSAPTANTTTDPITGVDNTVNPGTTTDPTGYSNTSNGNQVAVLSTLDYSTHQEVNYISITTVNQQITNTTMLQPTAPAASPTSSAADGVTSSQAANGADSSLRRSGHRYRLGSRHFFGQTNGRWRVDRLLDFRAADGDQLQLSRRFFKGIGELEFRSVDSRRELRLAARSDDDILYFEPKGCLYLNANGADQGFGRRGGLFAILENSPTLSSDHLQIG